MKIIVLGAAAGGGFPQWNAASSNNRLAFAGDPSSPPATQCSLAVSSNGDDWLLLNASPDIRQQIIATPELHPRQAPRSSPIKAIILTGADIDAIAGLLTLRERQPYTIWATDYVQRVIEANSIFNVMDRRQVRFESIPNNQFFEPLPGLMCRPIPSPGKPPLYLESVDGIGPADGASIGVRVSSNQSKSLTFLPSCAEVTENVRGAIEGTDLLFFDGTLYTDDEMINAGEGTKTAGRMGHVAMTGSRGAIEGLRNVKARERLFIHINNSNPVLNRKSAERRAIGQAGWRVAEDGMRFEL